MNSFVVWALCFGSLSCCMMKDLPISLVASFCKLSDKIFLKTSELILLLPSCVTSLMKINEPVPEEAMKAQAITLPPLCFRWACMFGIMSRSFFLQTLAFPSLWSIKSVHKTLSQNFWGSSPILLANEWFASSGVASVLFVHEVFCEQ